MKKKTLSIILILLFSLNLSVTAFAVMRVPTGEVVGEITIEIPGRDGLQLTIANVIDGVTVNDSTFFLYYIPTETTFSFNQDTYARLAHLGDGDDEWAAFEANRVYTCYTVWRGDWWFVDEDFYNTYKDENRPPISISIVYLDMFPIYREFYESGGMRLDESAVSIYTYEARDTVQPPVDTTPAETPSGWAAGEVNAAIEAGLVPDELQRNYGDFITRGEMAQMFINLIEKASGQSIEDFMAEKGVAINENAFTDTNNRAVLAANALDIINGVGNGMFDPDGIFKRAHIAVMVNRVARVLGIDTEGHTHSFVDLGGHWAEPELGWPVHAGIIEGVGDNRFDPEGNLTTEMAIVLAYRALAPLSQ